MQLFDKKSLEILREKAKNSKEYLEYIENSTKNVRKLPKIPATAKSTWGHYYVCPKHGTKFIYDYFDEKNYVCPVDNEVYTGEPYEGGWWAYTVSENINSARLLAIGYALYQNEEYLQKAKFILLEHAKYYKDYEVHGDIPYNHPGKMGSQVLDDSSSLTLLCFAYSLISDSFTDDEKECLKNGLFFPAAEHFKKYRTDQIHNHEVCIDCAIGAIGIVTENKDLIDFALNSKYGLKYQLDNAVLDDGLWFECSMGYHLYALRWFTFYEMFARNTEHTLFAHPDYKDKIYKMLVYPLNLLDENGDLPYINDGGASLKGNGVIYEFAYTYFKTPELAFLLNETRKSNSICIERILFGTEPDEIPDIKPKSYITESGSNLAIIHGSDSRYLMLKATPYGGEHDHYDRLSVSFSAFGKKLSADLGTTLYGSPLHYGYYKNTANHNTVIINGENMAPCATKVNKYEKISETEFYLDAETLAPDSFVMPDSFTIKQWSDEAYKGVTMRRRIFWQDKYFVDIFDVKSDNDLKKEWTWHVEGERTGNGTEYPEKLNENGAQGYLHTVTADKRNGTIKNTYSDGDTVLDIYAKADGVTLIHAKGPNNPATNDISYLLERTCEKNNTFVNVIEAHKTDGGIIKSVEITDNTVTVTTVDGKKRMFEY